MVRSILSVGVLAVLLGLTSGCMGELDLSFSLVDLLNNPTAEERQLFEQFDDPNEPNVPGSLGWVYEQIDSYEGRDRRLRSLIYTVVFVYPGSRNMKPLDPNALVAVVDMLGVESHEGGEAGQGPGWLVVQRTRSSDAEDLKALVELHIRVAGFADEGAVEELICITGEYVYEDGRWSLVGQEDYFFRAVAGDLAGHVPAKEDRHCEPTGK